jgi:hypothetical protein
MFYKNNFSKLIIYAIPGILGGFFSLVTVILFVNYLTSDIYANFLLQHLVITFGTSVLSLYIGRITLININNLSPIKKKEVIYSSLILMSVICFILSLITYIFLIIFIKNINLFDVTISIFVGLFFSSIYQNMEDIAKGLALDKVASMSNLIFMNLSVTIPAFLLAIYNTEFIKSNLFNISVSIKILTTLFILLVIIRTQKIRISKFDISFFLKFKIQNLFLSIYGILDQLYYALDKYVIKNFLSSFQLVTYSLSQQISSKIGIISYACSSLMFNKILKNPNDKKDILSGNLYFCFYFCSFGYLLVLPFFDALLSILLKNKFNNEISNSLKLFILVNIISALKDCIDGFLRTTLKLEKDLKFSASIVPFYLLGVLICIYSKNLTYFILLLLLKEVSMLFLKIKLTREYLINYLIFVVQILILNIIIILNLFFNYKELYIALYIIFFITAYINFNRSIIKKYFF